MNAMNTAPKDGTRILLHYKIYTYHYERGYDYEGTKWEEFVYAKSMGMGPETWTEWCGSKRFSTHTVKDEHCIGWLELPKGEE